MLNKNILNTQIDHYKTKLVEMEFQLSYFNPKEILLKFCTNMPANLGKLEEWLLGLEKCFHSSPKKGNAKNVHTNAQYTLSHTLAK